jgi:hypothetical protein
VPLLSRVDSFFISVVLSVLLFIFLGAVYKYWVMKPKIPLQVRWQ